MHVARRLVLLAPSAALATIVACGSRTGLFVVPDATADAIADVVEEPEAVEEPDATEEPDVVEELDASLEPETEAGEEDAPPPLDVIEEPLDLCPDAGSTLVYVITTQNVLMSFYPPTATFTTIGTISCPDPRGSMPFSMAVDRTSGIAYVVFYSGYLYRVSTATASCQPTPYVPGAGQGFATEFGMSFSANAPDAATPETLYVAGDPGAGFMKPSVLATIDTTTFTLTQIGQFSPIITGPELTGTGAGELFAFYAVNGGSDSAIAQIDRTTAQVTGQTTLTGVAQGGGWAFAFWGGDFYTFTAPGGIGSSSIVTRYRPSDGSIVQVASTPGLTIVGAGVSTCAPEQ